ncbi:hypothetical protein MKX03_031924 [Papaver bracteatum]|nr:hypothetical protein MKX03_031924 [Papaver bracteatum]
MNGDAENALSLFEEMEIDGMAYKGLQIFNSMELVYRIQPKSEHYGCMINLLGRAGLFEEAKENFLRMPTSCSPSDEAMTWRALLSSCCGHGETSVSEVAAERFV